MNRLYQDQDVAQKSKTRTTYNITINKNTPYIIDANNVHPGENLQLKVKNKRGRIIAKATDSHGSEDPHLMLTVDKRQRVKVVVQVEDDKNNKGKIPFFLAINKYDKNSRPKPNAKQRFNPDKTEQSNHSLAAQQKTTTTSDTPLTKLWQELSNSSEKISLNDLDNLLGSTTSDGSTVSQSEINLLNDILNDLEDHVDPGNLDYYSHVFKGAISSNPANANYTGGVKSINDVQELGNLSAGFNSDQVTLLQKKWFRGEDLPLAQIDGDSAADVPPSTFDYAEASGDLFDGTPSFTQLSQGNAGTCWFLSSLNAVANASTTSSKITGMFIDNKYGTYGVKFYGPQGTPAGQVNGTLNELFRRQPEDAGSRTSENLYEGNFVKPG